MAKRGRKPGGTKTPGSGRKKGTPNKITLDLITALEENNLAPVARIKRVWAKLKPGHQAEIALRLMEYVYPKRKAVDSLGHSHEDVKLHVTYETEWGNKAEPSDADANEDA